MLYPFPHATYAIARVPYRRPYDAPIAARAGELVQPVTDGAPTTDIMGWSYCRGADGREGWVPDAWCVMDAAGWRLVRDFDAMELSASPGDRFRLLLSESGFVFVEAANGDTGWLPDAVLELETGQAG